MLESAIFAICLQLFGYGLLVLSWFGWGSFLLQLSGYPVREKFQPVVPVVWTGCFATVLFLLAIHLVIPVKGLPITLWWLSGLALGLQALRLSVQSLRGWSRWGVVVAVTLPALVYLAMRAMATPHHPDSGLYHFQTIRWISEYSLVPGLGNLHGRLAFNQSIFPLTAALNVFPFAGRGYSIMNSSLLALALAGQLETFVSARDRKDPANIFALFLLPVLLWWLLTFDLSSPSSDLAAAIVQVQVYHLFLRFLFSPFFQPYERIPLFWLGAMLPTFKLSSGVFSATILLIVFLTSWKAGFLRIKEFFLLILPPGVLIGLMMVRGWILSGAPLYPSSLGYYQFPWSVPLEDLHYMHDEILAWARRPWTPVYEVLGNWQWLDSWIARLNQYRSDVLWPAFISALACSGMIAVNAFRASSFRLRCVLPALFPLVTSLVFWFFTAPDPRFALASFALFPVVLLGALILTLRPQVTQPVLAGTILLLLALQNFYPLGRLIIDPGLAMNVSTRGWQPLPVLPMKPWKNNQGIVFTRPEKGDKAWDHPLPTTPFQLPDLEVFDSEDLGSGFRTPDGLHTHYRPQKK